MNRGRVQTMMCQWQPPLYQIIEVTGRPVAVGETVLPAVGDPHLRPIPPQERPYQILCLLTLRNPIALLLIIVIQVVLLLCLLVLIIVPVTI